MPFAAIETAVPNLASSAEASLRTKTGPPHEVTRLLDAWSGGDPAALDHLIPLVVDDLRRLAGTFLARQRAGHTLQPTALVNEAYLRLAGRRTLSWSNRTHFFAYMATTMRRLLVNHARNRRAAKRGADEVCLSLNEAIDQPASHLDAGPEAVDLLALDQALEELAAVSPRQSRIVELRYFAGLTVEETGEVLAISSRTVKREWRMARLWLLRALQGVDSSTLPESNLQRSPANRRASETSWSE